jgi:hypothetical protein
MRHGSDANAQPDGVPADRQQQIALTAYYRWLARGGVTDGGAEQDWYEAEAELSRQRGSGAESPK